MMITSTLQPVFALMVLAHLALLLGCGQGLRTEKESKDSSSLPAVPDQKASTSTRALRQKRAPGWGKRDDEELDTFDGDVDNDDLLEDVDEPDVLALKRAPGWGKREFDMDKRAPGWGKRAPGWGKRAPGWGKRAPGWGKRAPGWGKRAPGWGKRSVLEEEAEDKRAPGWGKRAPGWGKRAPGWGKRAPGWGKRAVEDGRSGECELLSRELDSILDKAIETETRLQAFCGSSAPALDSTSRK